MTQPAHPTPTVPPQKAWPLLLLGGLAFVPILGVLFGFIAAVWGLVSSRPRALQAAVLGGAGMLLNFAGCAALGYWASQREGGGLAVEMARVELAELTRQLEAYRGRNHRYPGSLLELRAGPFGAPARNIYDRSAGIFNRTRLYQYRPAANGQRYTLFAVGPDGLPDTADDVYPTISDSEAGRTGLERRAEPAPAR